MNKRKIRLVLILLVLTTFISNNTVQAQDQIENNNKAVIFLFDSSGSMLTNDENRLAIDSIAQLTYALPSDYKVGVVSYNSDIVVSKKPVESSKRSSIMKAAHKIKYEKYSNAGKGLSKAVNLLEDEDASEKSIVLLSDGEILMKNDADTKKSLSSYKKAIKKAAKLGIKVHVIGLGQQMENKEDPIFDAADGTGGRSYLASHPSDIQDAIDSILIDEFDIKQTELAIVDADGKKESLSLECPFINASKVRILLTSEAPIKNLKTNFQAVEANQINGDRYALIEMKRPTSNKIDISFQGVSGSRIKIVMIPEYQITPRVNVEYEDKVPEDKEAVNYERTAEITYTFYDAENQNIQLWTEDFFNHNRIDLSVDNKDFQEYALKGGKITVEEPVFANGERKVAFKYSKLPFYIIGDNSLTFQLEGPPALPEEPEPPYLLIGIGVGVFAVAVGIIIWLIVRKKPEPLPPDDMPEPSKYSYTGKLNIYVTRTYSGYDIPPLTYNLFRLPSGKVISLAEILESCAVHEVFEGADKIYFKSGPNHNLILTNNSDCTVMKNREILMKKKSYQITVGSKVDIVFEDEISELSFQYKDLKPSEMR